MKASDYDTLFFESFANPERHIDRLFSQLRLRGIQAPPPSQARVLEIGCSTGVNIIPQAILYPRSEFVGVDISEGQIAEAQRLVSELNISNITLESCGIETLAAEKKSFDYIICHGLYSWVDARTQQALLDRIAYFLSPKGVAYLSFNTAIGWRGSAGVKEVLLDIGRECIDVSAKIRRVRELTRIGLAQFKNSQSISESKTMSFLAYLNTVSDALLLHEYLNPHASGTSVTELSCALTNHGLQYLGDARPQRDGTHPSILICHPLSPVRQLNRAAREDFNDLSSPKSFRGALLVHDSIVEQSITSGEQIVDLYFTSPLIELSESTENGEILFMLGEDHPCQINEPPIIAIVRELIRNWPVAIRGQEINITQLNSEQLNSFIALVCNGAIQVSYGSFECTNQLSDKPCTSPFIRYKARAGGTLISLKHEFFNANVFEIALLPLLDGSRTVEQLTESMFKKYQNGELTFTGEKSTEITPFLFRDAVEMALKEFLEHGLLLK